MKQVPVILLLSLTVFSVAATETGSGIRYQDEAAPPMLAKGPPAHAPAHGRRKQERFQYKYYPDAEVYFDPSRNLYFYLSGGSWVAKATLPRRLKVNLGGSVELDMDLAKPYKLHKEHLELHPPKLKIKLR